MRCQGKTSKLICRRIINLICIFVSWILRIFCISWSKFDKLRRETNAWGSRIAKWCHQRTFAIEMFNIRKIKKKKEEEEEKKNPPSHLSIIIVYFCILIIKLLFFYEITFTNFCILINKYEYTEHVDCSSGK